MRDEDRGAVYRELMLAIRREQVSHPIVARRVSPFLAAAAAGESRLSSPTMVTWNVTRACTLTCTYCAADAPQGRPDTARATRDAILAKIVEMRPVFVSLLGGEPTLAPEIGEAVTTLVDHGIHADMTTNGARVSPDLAETISGLDPAGYSIMLSIDSYDRATNDAARGRGAFATAARAAERLAARGVPFSVGMTVGPWNLHDLEQTYDLACRLGAAFFCSWFVMPAGRARISDVALPDDEFVRQAYRVLERARERATKVSRMDMSVAVMRWLRADSRDRGIAPEASELASRAGCEGCRFRVLVDHDGSVFPCDFLQVPEFRMGNILHDSWPDVWNSRPARVKASLSRRTKPGCRTCSMQDCDTGCFGVTFAHFKRTGELLPMCEVCG